MTTPEAGGTAPDPREEAAAWVVRRQAGALDADAQARLRRWLAADPANPAALDAALSAWELLGASGRARRRTRRAAAGVVAGRLAAPAAAAACVLLAAAGWMQFGHARTFATGIGETRAVTLADGSTVRLDARTRLKARLTPLGRTVELAEGRALFTVARDARRPFRVRTDGLQVTALGTRFAVSEAGAADSAFLLEGRVEAAQRGGGAKLRLRPGEGVRADGGGLVRLAADPQTELAWAEGRIVLRGATLAEALELFARYAPGEVRVPDARVAALRVSGSFRTADRAAFLAAAAELHGLRIEAEPAGGWRLVR